ncbi:uncharacterized protein VTP21DRAFT_7389 [Calcarisporiella thermophila]|uniref:uncharacterized protein n=1 Tax=Calcarisporiella thermophila TaxID=911321 RepID=UPI003742E209
MSVLSHIATTIIFPLQSATLPLFHFPLLSALHGIRVALEFRRSLEQSGTRREIGWLQGFFAIMVASVGGSTTSAILMGIPPGWLASNTVLPAYAATYFAVFYLPGVYPVLLRVRPLLDPFLISADGLTRFSAITSFAIDACHFRPEVAPRLGGSWIAMLVCGTIAGCGGGLWNDALQLGSAHWGLRTPRGFKTPTWDMAAAFLTAACYTFYSMPEILRFETKGAASLEEAKALSAFVMVGILLGRWALVNFSRLFAGPSVPIVDAKSGEKAAKQDVKKPEAKKRK